MATGTVAPSPIFTGFDSNGDPLNGGLLYTYIAGTTTPAATYSDVDLAPGHTNTNPIVLDTAGRAVIFLPPGGSFKFALKTSAGATVWTVDNVTAVPSSSSALDLSGTAGEAIGTNIAVYLSDGSGGKNAGQWYIADSANSYSSSAAGTVGISIAPIAAGSSGTIRTAGIVTGFSGLVAGTTYYIGTAGALTAIAPTNARVLGIADSTTSLVLTPAAAVGAGSSGLDIVQIEALL